jgi:hypothetical protein
VQVWLRPPEWKDWFRSGLEGDDIMGKIECLVLKIILGIFAAANLFTCIFTTDFVVLVTLNVLLAAGCLGVFLFVQRNISGLSKDLGISRKEANKLVGDYFAYYKNVEKISIDEYLKIS